MTSSPYLRMYGCTTEREPCLSRGMGRGQKVHCIVNVGVKAKRTKTLVVISGHYRIKARAGGPIDK